MREKYLQKNEYQFEYFTRVQFWLPQKENEEKRKE